LADRVINLGLSVRDTELAAKALPTKPKIKLGGKQQALNTLAEKIGDSLDTKVKIKLGARKGTITIDFASVDDLNRIVKAMGLDIKY
jgi:ParB family chromosome partitioning protein